MAILLFPIILLGLIVCGIFVAKWMKPGTANGQNASHGLPGCGQCGYPTRGISELICPECGADLRKVGIAKPGEGRSPLAGCLMPLLFTITLPLLAVLGYSLSSLIVPSYEKQSTHFDLIPESDAYSEVLVQTELTLIIPAGQSHLGHNFQINSNLTPPHATTIHFGGGTNAKVVVESLVIEVMSMPMRQSPNTITYASPFSVDPATRVATWTDAKGNSQSSTGPVTDKDVLAYLAAYNVDTSRQEVALEAKQIVGMIDGLIAGNNQFTLQGFENGGFGSGGSGTIGPSWFIGVYCLAWFVIWIVITALLGRRARKASQPA